MSAWGPEQAFLRAQGLPKDAVSFLLTGVGPLRACAQMLTALQNALQAGRPFSHVSFVGTAGVYDLARFPLLSAHQVSRAVFTDGAAALGLSYFPAEPSPSGRSFVSPFHLSGEEWTCVCPPSITRDARLATALASLGEFENLELAGVAEACAQKGVPWDAFLGVSNAVGPSAHDEWKASHEASSVAAQKLFLRVAFESQAGHS